MKLTKLLLVSLGLSLAACSTPSGTATAPGTVSTPVEASGGLGTATALDEKALYAAEALYNVPAQAYVAADARKLMQPDLKAQVKPMLVQAYAYLQKAREAYNAGNSADFAGAVALLRTLSADVKRLIPSKPDVR